MAQQPSTGMTRQRHSISAVRARVGAAVIDGLFIFLLVMIGNLLSSLLPLGLHGYAFVVRFVLPPLLITGFYFVIYTWKTGTTPGKKMMGLVVLGLDGGPVDFRRSMIRYVAQIALGYLGVTPLVILFNRKRRSLPDFVAGTIVLRDHALQVRRSAFAFAMVVYLLPLLYLAKVGGEVWLSQRKPVSERLRSDNVFVQMLAASKLGSLSAKEKSAVAKDLERSLVDDDKTVQWRALESAEKLGEAAKPLLPKIVDLLASQGSTVTREKAAEALGGMGPWVLPHLRKLLFVRDRPVDKKLMSSSPTWKLKQVGALLALGHMGTPGVPLLSEVCRGQDLGVRDEATAALAKIGGKEAKSALKSCSNYVPELYYHKRSIQECEAAWNKAVANYPRGRRLKYSMSVFAFGEVHDSYTYSSTVVESIQGQVKIDIENAGMKHAGGKKPAWTKEVRRRGWQRQCLSAQITGDSLAGYHDSWTQVAVGHNVEYPTIHRTASIAKVETVECTAAGEKTKCKRVEMGDGSRMRELWFSAGSDPFVVKIVDKRLDHGTGAWVMDRSQELVEYQAR